MTCMMTDIPEITNIIPSSGIYSEFPEKTETHEMKPPRASEPVSPINTAALLVLNMRNAATAPTPIKQSKPVSEPRNASIIPIISRYAQLVPPASPSSPSVRFTQLTVAIKINTTRGIIPQPISTEILEKGIFSAVLPLK